MPHPGLLHPGPCPCGSPLLTCTSTGDIQTQFCLSLCGSWCTQGLFEPSEHLSWMGFDSKCDFAPPTVLLGFLLCPWMLGISSKLLQGCTAAAPAPTSMLGLLCPWTWGISSQSLQQKLGSQDSQEAQG